MPPVSQAQRRWAWANKGKNTKEGKAAAEYAAADPGGKLPAYSRSSHHKGNPGFPSTASKSPPSPKEAAMGMKKQKTPRPGAGHSGQSGGHGELTTGTSGPTAGAKAGGGTSVGGAEHHVKSGQAEDNASFRLNQPGHFHAEHHKGYIHDGTAHRFPGTQNKGRLRVSGHGGAHMLGCKK